jgi:hypothetical protein
MIFAMLMRSLDILQEKGLPKTGLQQLRTDAVAVARKNGWTD